MRALRIGGWANLAIAAAHIVLLVWPWTVFGWVGIEHEKDDVCGGDGEIRPAPDSECAHLRSTS